MAEKVIDRFFRYVQIDTQSKEDAESFPSTEKQKNLAGLNSGCYIVKVEASNITKAFKVIKR